MKRVLLVCIFCITSIVSNASAYKILKFYVVPKHNGVAETLSENHLREITDEYIIIDQGSIKIGRVSLEVTRLNQNTDKERYTDFVSGDVIDDKHQKAIFGAIYKSETNTTSIVLEYENVQYWFLTRKVE